MTSANKTTATVLRTMAVVNGCAALFLVILSTATFEEAAA